ncbi:MAG: cation-transporting P-type ATPase [Acidimicrobiales bacterium]|jgi:magnesium-transporting ATPase (P-type)|nr:cation-transporting P-type ATPase [Acidimicrobiales bacterium]
MPEPGTAPPTDVAVGLTATEAARRLEVDGPNRLPPPPRVAAWRHLVGEVTHFFAAMLWVAAGLAVLAGMPQLGVAIVVVIVVNGVFAFVQEQRAELAAQRLGELLPARVVVRRDGVPCPVDAADVVVGDLVVLEPGDRVPADLDLVEADELSFDVSTLTGESVPADGGVGDRAHAGTFVAGGSGLGLVTATGAQTRLAGIAQLTAGVKRPRSPLALELHRIVRTIALMAVGVGVAFFVLSLLVGTSAQDGFLFAVGVTVALVPEGLLPTVTLSLAMGAQRLADRNGLVRHLEAVETLGSTTFICTDKTGTLTRNQMNVVAAWTAAGRVEAAGQGYEPGGSVAGPPDALATARTLADAARAASQGRIEPDADHEHGWVSVGDPMEGAIDAFAHRLRAEGTLLGEPEVAHRFAFDPVRRRESAVVDGWLVVKGAPDSVLPRCVSVHLEHLATADDAEPAGALARADAMVQALASSGLRVLAVARRPAPDPAAWTDGDEAEVELELLGLLGLQDPPRDGVQDAIAAARRAGIRLAMLTGDHPTTARAIAREIGFFTDEREVVLEGHDLPADEQVLGAVLDRDGVVISRVSPEDKLRVARALQARGHVLAMTGDGVNDGPALQEADIGVAMGRSGTDVARAAADLVLLDDDFSTIVAAVEQGRATFTNIRRFLTYHLTDNVAELTPFVVWALSGGRFPLALGVLQILCLDIGTDLLPALALGNERPTPGVMDRPPEGRHLIDRPLLARVFGVLGPVEAGVAMVAFTIALVVAGWSPGEAFPTGPDLLAASGAAFAAVLIGQAGNAFACRSATRPPGRLGWFTNRLLVIAIVVQLLALAAFLLVEPLAELLEHRPPPPAAFVVSVLAAPAVLAADRIHKVVRARRRAAT